METKLINKAMIGVMREVKGIGKDSVNQQQKFRFRGIDTIYNELHGLMSKHGIITMPEVLSERGEERQTRNGATLIYRILTIRYNFIAEDGSSVSCVTIGEGMDSGDKASNKAMSVAHKYALLQCFMIPTDDIADPDAESHSVAPRQQKSREQYIKELIEMSQKTNLPPNWLEWFATINDKKDTEIIAAYNQFKGANLG